MKWFLELLHVLIIIINFKKASVKASKVLIFAKPLKSHIKMIYQDMYLWLRQLLF